MQEVHYDSSLRAPKADIEVFREGKEPARPTKEIASWVFAGIAADEPKAENAFIVRAKKAGADALIIRPPQNERPEIGVFGMSNHAIFKAVAVVYVQN